MMKVSYVVLLTPITPVANTSTSRRLRCLVSSNTAISVIQLKAAITYGLVWEHFHEYAVGTMVQALILFLEKWFRKCNDFFFIIIKLLSKL